MSGNFEVAASAAGGLVRSAGYAAVADLLGAREEAQRHEELLEERLPVVVGVLAAVLDWADADDGAERSAREEVLREATAALRDAGTGGVEELEEVRGFLGGVSGGELGGASPQGPAEEGSGGGAARGRTVPPWDDEQVRRLNEFQHSGQFHPFTCPNRGEVPHRWTADRGVLVATRDGWVCPDCDYTQAWAHAFMAEPGLLD